MLKINNKLVLFLLSFLSLILLSSCSYENTTINLGSEFDSTWTFSNSSDYEFDENLVEVVNGKAQLKALDLEHSGADFNDGNHVGSYLSDSTSIKFITKTNSSLDVREILPERASTLRTYLKFESSIENYAVNGQDGTMSGSLPYSSDSQVGTSSITTDLNISNILQVPSANVGTSAFTASVWINPSAHNDWGRLLAESNANPDQDWIILEHSDDGNWYFIITMSNGANCGTNSSRYITVPLNSWTHLTAVYSGSSVSLYQNGILAAGPVICSLPIRNDISNLTIGSNGNGGSGLDASIDELAIWGVELNPEDIYKLYNSQSQNFSELSPDWTPKWDNIVGYWKMDGNWQDSSGNGEHGAPIDNASFEYNDKNVGIAGGVFDGSLDGVMISNSSNLAISDSTSFSYSAWIKVHPSGVGTTGNILRCQNSSYHGLRYISTGLLQSLFGNPGDTVESINSSSVIADSVWYHVGFTRNTQKDSIEIHINGQLDNSEPDDSTGVWTTTCDVFLGRYPGNDLETFDGIIDDVAFWKEALSSSDFLKIYNRQKQKYAGHYDSKVIDLGSTAANWPDLSWATSLPFGKELVGDFDNDGNPDSENLSDYSHLESSLGSFQLSYWKMNEVGWSGVLSEVQDSSGQGNHGQAIGGTTTQEDGLFGRKGLFNGVTDYINLELNTSDSNSGTISAWVYIGDNARLQYIFSETSLLNDLSIWAPIRIDSSGVASIFVRDSTNSFANKIIGSTILENNKWYHIVTSSNGNRYRIFINGAEEVISVSQGANDGRWSNSVDIQDTFTIGALNRFSGTSFYFEGGLDELSIWERELTSSEVQQLYRRGANRVKIQVKSCVDSSCNCKSYGVGGSETDCDGDGTLNTADTDDIHKSEFIGPGGDGTTYYSEGFNRTNTEVTFNCALNITDSDAGVCAPDEILFSAGPKPTGPEFLNIDYTQFIKPPANRYAQYRVYMEADDNTACGGEPCLPELTSVSLNPTGATRYSSEYIKIKPKSPITFTKLISAEIDAENCATFRLSRSNTEYYFDGTSWVLATTNTHRNTASEVESNITKFASDHGAGELEVNAYLASDASQSTQCSVNSIDVKYE